MHAEEQLKDSRPLIIAYFTGDNGYAGEARNLLLTIRQFGYEYDIQEIDNFGSWLRNVMYKPIFIKKMLEKHKRSVLYLDADATIEREIDFTMFLDVDFAVPYVGNFWVNPATLFFRNTSGVIELIDKWINANDRHPDASSDQINLVDVLNEANWEKKIRILNLPKEYCSISDSIGRADNPIVLQHQASQRLAGIVEIYR